jgi:hypothetical protein
MIKRTFTCYANWDVRVYFYNNKYVRILIDKFDTSPIRRGEIRIVVVHEEKSRIRKHIDVYPKDYDYVLTYHKEILDNNPKARYFMGVTPFCLPDPDKMKKFGVSTIVSGRLNSEGHYLRHELWRRRNEIKIPKYFYLSSNPDTILNGADYKNELVCRHNTNIFDGKEVMMDCMFHIAIETISIWGNWSEKLVDCLLTKTVPVYWGCHNVGDYFDEKGIIRCENVDQIIQACNSLTEKDYWDRKQSIDCNYNNALKHFDFGKSLSVVIQQILDERQ